MYANHRAEPTIHDRTGSTSRSTSCRKPRTTAARLAVLACLVITVLACAGWASAATTWTVTTTADSPPPGNACNGNNTCATLRDAINTAADGDTIVFDLTGYTLPATITLANGALQLKDKSVTIHGPGYGTLTISAGNTSRVFDLVHVSASNPEATIDHLTISHGTVHGVDGFAGPSAGANGLKGDDVEGGCIYVGASYTLHLDFDLVNGCTALAGAGGAGGAGGTGGTGPTQGATGATGAAGASGPGGTGGVALGGGIYNDPAANGPSTLLEQTTIAFNVAYNGPGGNPDGSPGDALFSSGGGVFLKTGSMEICNSVIADNMGNIGSILGTATATGIQNCAFSFAPTLTNDNLENGSVQGDDCGFDVKADPNFAPQKSGNAPKSGKANLDGIDTRIIAMPGGGKVWIDDARHLVMKLQVVMEGNPKPQTMIDLTGIRFAKPDAAMLIPPSHCKEINGSSNAHGGHADVPAGK